MVQPKLIYGKADRNEESEPKTASAGEDLKGNLRRQIKLFASRELIQQNTLRCARIFITVHPRGSRTVLTMR